VSADRTCAIPIDDPQIQAYQPDFPQVEWAVDQAVQGTLTDTRGPGLYGSSLPSYTPQGMFPLPGIDGGGSGAELPAQVLLGVLTAESNLQQASQHDIQGQASNPLTSFNWYGNWINGETTDTGLVDWANSDCGYGIAQITSGMCLSKGRNNDPQCQYQAPLPPEQQLAIAVDYQANIAKAAQVLIGYWNELWKDGIQPDGYTQSYGTSSNPDFIDNWYMAVWAYNSGLEPGTSALGNSTGCTPGPKCTDGHGDWGLGYADNPINPAYPPDRPTFPGPSPDGYPGPGGATYSLNWDMSHPQYWPYQEKVLAWAYDSITLWDYSKGENVQAFAYAIGNYTPPPYNLFCTSADHCNASGVNPTKATGPDACQLTGDYADHCWWHVEPDSQDWPITAPTITCSDCGLSQITYPKGTPDPATEPIAPQFKQTCTEAPLPSSAVIVGDGGQAALGCPGKNWTSVGSFAWNFAADKNGNYSSKIDFDQIGAGFGGHFWFGYTLLNNGASATSTVPAPGLADQVITGTWTPPSSVTGWTQIEAAIPGVGDYAPIANYQVDPGGGQPARNVLINQSATNETNTWADLGDFDLASGAKVSLSNVAFGGTGVDIDWDAMAFIKTPIAHVNYVAMGDSYSAGTGNTPYFPDSNTSKDKCYRSMEDAYPMMVTLPGEDKPIASQTADGFSFIACNAAETTGVTMAAVNPVDEPNPVYPASEIPYNKAGNTDWGYEQYNTPWQKNKPPGPVEGLQAVNRALSPSTNLVTISIGGNDSRFADVIWGCLKAATILKRQDCGAAGWTLTRKSTKAKDPDPLQEFEPKVINYLEAHLVQTYVAINAVAPNADIVVVGYPNLFPANPTAPCDSGSITGKAARLSVDAQEMLNDFGTDLNNAISQAVSQAKNDFGVDIQFVNPTSAFAGHELCSSDPWFLPLSLTNVASSYHPNPAGQAKFADLVNQCLAGTLSC
jgi:lysophospholipase L1-like esterase